jgi:hypothetical protein
MKDVDKKTFDIAIEPFPTPAYEWYETRATEGRLGNAKQVFYSAILTTLRMHNPELSELLQTFATSNIPFAWFLPLQRLFLSLLFAIY